MTLTPPLTLPFSGPSQFPNPSGASDDRSRVRVFDKVFLQSPVVIIRKKIERLPGECFRFNKDHGYL
jgi:hypothetical protein